ncbi:hypothetical protein [Plantactinospora sp. KBS50]|uniref:hypothetical protein n=1 Tax=Plantactinospora sp. KBS50 TaxID=2024580 RepID=UPI000BAB1B64|nr:hypothetical protein [Plantactinospora sp. KBS50]ASW56429.1 hypothetical protein CIK06_23115 [Plantactinospora sp. KBS50]
MDLLDLLRLMLRRWYVTVPVLLLTLAGAVVVGQRIDPEYKTSAAIVLIPPTTPAPEPERGTAPRPGNPWLAIGGDQMAQAVQISVSARPAQERVVRAGGQAGYKVSVVARTSILSVDVTASSRSRALATVTTVTRLIGEEVAARQAEYRPRAGEQITTKVLDAGLDIGQSRSNVLRAQLVLLVLGLLAAAAGAAVLDAVLRHRSARRTRRPRAQDDAVPATRARVEPAALDAAPPEPAPGARTPVPVPAPARAPGGPDRRAPVPADWDVAPAPDDTVVLTTVRRVGRDDR